MKNEMCVYHHWFHRLQEMNLCVITAVHFDCIATVVEEETVDLWTNKEGRIGKKIKSVIVHRNEVEFM